MIKEDQLAQKTKDDVFKSLRIKITGNSDSVAPYNLAEVFKDRQGIYLNEVQFYLAYYNRIPNFLSEVKINCDKANAWFANTYKHEINDWYYDKRYFRGSTSARFDDVFYMLDKDLMVNFDTNSNIVRFLFRETNIEKVETLQEQIKKFRMKNERRKPSISILVNSTHGVETQAVEINSQKLSIDENYNDDFIPIHQLILKRLNKKNDKGIVLLHGKPGTGKTSYIRYLVTKLRKQVIFLPPNMANALTGPGLLSMLVENPNSILIIEDAENLVLDRNKDGNSPVTVLLNISDGLLSDCLNIQIICSFNTDISKVDNALLRKGRLIARYEFKELEVHKAQQLCQKLEKETKIHKPITLTDIYNYEEQDFITPIPKRSIGFQTMLNEVKMA